MVEGIPFFEGQLVQQLAVDLVTARIPFQQDVETRDEHGLALLYGNHHLGGGLLVPAQGDLGLVVAVDLQGLLHALGDLGAGGAILTLLIDGQGIEIGLDVILLFALDPLDLIGQLGRHGRRHQQQQAEGEPQCAKPATNASSRRCDPCRQERIASCQTSISPHNIIKRLNYLE
ncbi:hypothetical protein D3C80_1285750 [compost metagenome]